MKRDDAIFYFIICFLIIGLLSYQNYNLKKINTQSKENTQIYLASALHDIELRLSNIIEVNDQYSINEFSLNYWGDLLKSVEEAKTSTSILGLMYLKPSEETAKIQSIFNTLNGLEFFLNKTINFIEREEPFEITHRIKFKNEEDILEEMKLYTELLGFLQDEEYYKGDYWNYLIKHWDIEKATYINTPIDRDRN